MKKENTKKMIALYMIAIVFVLGSMFIYNEYVHESLWQQSVNDILEATSQEEKAFDIYVSKEITNSRNVWSHMLEEKRDEATTLEQLSALVKKEGSQYLFLDLKQNKCYSSHGVSEISKLQQDLILNNDKEEGLIEPYFEDTTGVKMFATFVKGSYEGRKGVMIKETKESYMAQNFSLSFFNDLGFSYIIDSEGMILLRSSHPNSNRTFQNLFDLIDLSGNDESIIHSFQQTLKEKGKGIAQFDYQDESNVFCYVPIKDSEDWFMVSIIPNAAIMKQANHIIFSTILLCTGIVFVIGCLVWMYLRSNHRHKEELERMAYYDDLTQLYTYQRFKMKAEELLKESKNWYMLYLDIADFKIINEMYGYHYGDEILKQLAEALKELVGKDGIICRINADKFLIMLHCLQQAELMAFCEHINQSISLHHATKQSERTVMVRIGICDCDPSIELSNVDGWIDRSHLALNRVKADSPNCYAFYNKAMHDQMLKKADIENKMEKALAQREFQCYLQPKYDVSGHVLMGAEALVRWIEQDHMIMPGDFIPVFEKNGFILKLDEYIFEEVCRYLGNRLKKNEAMVPISVNISRMHFHQPDFVERYIKIKDAYAIPDGLIELEITENILLYDIDQVRTIVMQLQRSGLTCSIDDFGSGYSSLNVLKDLPFDVLKLDGVFLRNSYDVSRSQEIVRSIIEMAKRIHLKTVAEGVESEEQLSFLKEVGCDMIQGFVFARPMPISEFDKRLVTETLHIYD